QAIIYGGTQIGPGVVVEERTIVGKPEFGYAVGLFYPGAGAPTLIGAGSILRAGAIVYAGVRIGEATAIGHGTLVRSDVSIGSDSQLAHFLSVERASRIGSFVRCSPLSHLTSGIVLEDRVFLGAGVLTINDKSMVWRDPERDPELFPPRVEYGAKVGSGSTIAAGVVIGRGALVGSGSLVTRDVPPNAIAYGV